MHSITYRPVFWISAFILSALMAFFSIHYFCQAFPLVNVPITMNRAQAIEQAALLADTLQLGPDNYHHAASFETDSLVQTFIELEAGGKEAFNKMIESHLYEPYVWKVRHFKEYSAQESTLFFTPVGNKYGFIHQLSQETILPSLSQQDAQALVQQFAQEWGIFLDSYALLEASHDSTPGGRVDHTFVYQRHDITIGEGFYRLKMVVRGNKMTELTHSVKVPESFVRRYMHMRSYNNTLAMIATLIMMLFYFVGCCIIGLFFLLRKNFVIWRPAFIWGFFISLLVTLVNFNQLPLLWMNYTTAFSIYGFLAQLVVQNFITFFYQGFFFSFIFMGAESLTRKAFGNHIQFWQLAKFGVANSYEVVGRTLGGYLLVSLLMAIIVSFYLFTSRYFNWWIPSSVLFNPNILATYAPWFSPLASSLQAGFMEECLFRAVPLSTAAILGNKYGKKKWWIGATFILQALVFGAAHANYPAQPFYARLVELIIPSGAFGAIFLLFGLLPAIISHFIYDVVWFALPLFISTAPGAWINKALVIILSLIPVWIVLYSRIKAGNLTHIHLDMLNREWKVPAQSTTPFSIKREYTHYCLSKRFLQIFSLVAAQSLLLWFYITPFIQYALPINTPRTQAQQVAEQCLLKNSISLSPCWSRLIRVFTNYQETEQDLLAHQFVWQHDSTADKRTYRRLLEHHYLSNPHWIIRFAQFEGDIIKRAKEYLVHIDQTGEACRTHIILPESYAGPQLSVEEARIIAYKHLQEKYNFSSTQVQEIAATATQHPERKDWNFIFFVPSAYALGDAQARITITISGDVITNSVSSIFVPEGWKRFQQGKKQITNSIQMFTGILLLILFLLGALGALIQWSIYTFSSRFFFSLFFGWLFLLILNALNQWQYTIAHFNTIQPFYNQCFMVFAGIMVQLLFESALYALIISFMLEYKGSHLLHNRFTRILLGIGAGIIVSAAYILIPAFYASPTPLWANYSPLNGFFPILALIIHSIKEYVACTIFLLLLVTIIEYITRGWHQKKLLVLPLFLITAAVLQDIGSLEIWAAQSLLVGIVLYTLYAMLIHYENALIPIMTATFYATLLLQQAVFNAYPQAALANGVAIVCLMGISYNWFKWLHE